MKRFGILLVIVALITAYLLLWPVPFEPVIWKPAAAPSADAYPDNDQLRNIERLADGTGIGPEGIAVDLKGQIYAGYADRSEEHTSELQSLMRISYAVFCLKKKTHTTDKTTTQIKI